MYITVPLFSFLFLFFSASDQPQGLRHASYARSQVVHQVQPPRNKNQLPAPKIGNKIKEAVRIR